MYLEVSAVFFGWECLCLVSCCFCCFYVFGALKFFNSTRVAMTDKAQSSTGKGTIFFVGSGAIHSEFVSSGMTQLHVVYTPVHGLPVILEIGRSQRRKKNHRRFTKTNTCSSCFDPASHGTPGTFHPFP